MAAQLKNHRYQPYKSGSTEVPSTTSGSANRIDRVVSNFMLSPLPYTQLSIGLRGLDVEIILSRAGNPFFDLTFEEFRELKNKKTVLSCSLTVNGNITCISRPSENDGLVFERKLESYNTDDCETLKMELSRSETLQLEKHLPQAWIAIERLITNKPVFNAMYGVITLAMMDTFSRMNTLQDIVEMYDELSHRFHQYTSRAYLVREYLNLPNCVNSPFQLYNVVETCLDQPAYLKKRFTSYLK